MSNTTGMICSRHVWHKELDISISCRWVMPCDPKFIVYHFQQLMVAEKNGFIRFYDLISQRPIMSLSAGQVPLISADWCKTNGLKAGAVASDDWLIWDMSKSRYATRKTLYPWRVPIGTRHSFVNILWISMNFFHENCLVKIFSLKS